MKMRSITDWTWPSLALAIGVAFSSAWIPEASAGNAPLTPQTLTTESSATGIAELRGIPPKLTFAGSHAAMLPGQLEIAQYGEFEDVGCARFGSFLGVRFDPPLDPPYRIVKIRFPSVTKIGASALFPSVRVLGTNAQGRIASGPPLFEAAPYEGAGDGWNEVPLDLTITEPNQIFYLCVEFPPVSGVIPDDYPFLRMDSQEMERGWFANSYFLSPTAGAVPGLLRDRNIIASMICEPANPEDVPIESSKNLGANRIKSDTSRYGRLVFSFTRPTDVRADGTPMTKNSLRRTDLLFRPVTFFPWRRLASAGPERDEITTDTLAVGAVMWTTQAVDKSGHRAVPSNAVETVFFQPGIPTDQHDDAYEPNGRVQDATQLLEFPLMLGGTIYPAGDQDFYTIDARPGEEIRAVAGGSGNTGTSGLDLVMFLYDKSGSLVASDDNSAGLTTPEINYVVPASAGRGEGSASHRYTLLVSDIHGSSLSPDTAPRVVWIYPFYVLTVWVSGASDPVKTGTAAAGSAAPAGARQVERFGIIGSNVIGRGELARFSLDEGSPGATVRIYDVQGRLVRALVGASSSRARQSTEWDGTDDHGRLAPAGIYFARMESRGAADVVRVVLIR